MEGCECVEEKRKMMVVVGCSSLTVNPYRNYLLSMFFSSLCSAASYNYVFIPLGIITPATCIYLSSIRWLFCSTVS